MAPEILEHAIPDGGTDGQDACSRAAARIDEGFARRVVAFLNAVALTMDASGVSIDGSRINYLASMIRDGLPADQTGNAPEWLVQPWLSWQKRSPEQTVSVVKRLVARVTTRLPIGTAEEVLLFVRRLEALDMPSIHAAAGMSARQDIFGDAALNLYRSWLYVGACLGCRGSMTTLGRMLVESADFENVGLVRHLGAAWQRLACAMVVRPGNAVNPSEEAEMRMREASFDLRCLDKWAAEKGIMLPPATRGGRAGSASVRALAEGSPSLQVLEAIGDPLSTDGKSAVVRFGALERPLALVSAAIEPDAIYATLRSEFPWIEEGARIVAQTVALSASRSTRHYRAAPLILWGPAGCGKSRWVRRVRELLGIPGDYLALGGAASSACVMGCERSWQGGRPSFPVATMAREQCANPVLVVDELDKAGTSRINGTPVDALLPMLDPETSRHYADVYLLSPVDLSEVTWLIPLNDLGLLPDTLVSRAHVIRASRPEARHFDLLVTCMIADYAARESLQVADLPPLNADMAALRKTFEETLSPRGLRLAMEKALGASIWAPPGPRLLAVGGDNDIVAGAE